MEVENTAHRIKNIEVAITFFSQGVLKLIVIGETSSER